MDAKAFGNPGLGALCYKRLVCSTADSALFAVVASTFKLTAFTMGRDIIALDDLTVNNLGVFKKINEVSLATKYPDSWYLSSLNSDQVVKLAFYSELPVGAIKGKLINTNNKTASFETSTSNQLVEKSIPNAIYIESLAVLEAYRKHGIATKLLDWLVAVTKEKFVHQIVLHAHVDETAAIEWYKKRGFVQAPEVIKDYYKQQGLPHPDAVVLSLTT